MSLHEKSKAYHSYLPTSLSSHTRSLVEKAVEAHQAAIEGLIAFLDQADGDTDMEPYLAGSGDDDREQDVGDEGEDGADDDIEDENRCPMTDDKFAM